MTGGSRGSKLSARLPASESRCGNAPPTSSFRVSAGARTSLIRSARAFSPLGGPPSFCPASGSPAAATSSRARARTGSAVHENSLPPEPRALRAGGRGFALTDSSAFYTDELQLSPLLRLSANPDLDTRAGPAHHAPRRRSFLTRVCAVHAWGGVYPCENLSEPRDLHQPITD